MENGQYIDMTPTWSGSLPVLLHLVEYATTPEARATATSELARMANLADLYVKLQNDASEARAAAGESAYALAMLAGGSQRDWDAAYETAYDECCEQQRQAAEQEYQDAHNS